MTTAINQKRNYFRDAIYKNISSDPTAKAVINNNHDNEIYEREAIFGCLLDWNIQVNVKGPARIILTIAHINDEATLRDEQIKRLKKIEDALLKRFNKCKNLPPMNWGPLALDSKRNNAGAVLYFDFHGWQDHASSSDHGPAKLDELASTIAECYIQLRGALVEIHTQSPEIFLKKINHCHGNER